jgi:glycosyltransferase involved in cell wall biosynthesis
VHILNLLPYSPCPPHFGGALRIFYLLREMLRLHDVTVVMYGTDLEGELVRKTFGGRLKRVHTVAKPLRLTGLHKRLAQIRSLAQDRSATTNAFYSDAMQKTIDSVVSGVNFDLVQLETHHPGLYRIDAPGVPHIIDVQNVEYDNVRRMARASSSPLRRAFYDREYRKLHREETDVFGAQDAILVTSARDKSLIDEEFPRIPKFVVPNGVDMSYFRPKAGPADPHSLVFTGAMNYFPNADGMMHFLKEVFPLIRKQIADARVCVVGGGPPKQLVAMASENVEVTGFVEDVRPHVRHAAICIVPLRMGGGTRLKVLEAMAMERPVVTTSVGCEGIHVQDRETALIADDPELFAASVVALMRDQDLYRKLVRNGRELVRAHYEWSEVGDRLGEVYDWIMDNRHHGSTMSGAGNSAGAMND